MLTWSMLWACGGQQIAVALPDAGGLQPGAGVWVSGIEVGKVSDVKLAGDQVMVIVQVDPQHELALHEDACAIALPGEPARLEVWAGSEGTLSGPVEPCRITQEDLRELARAAGETMSSMAREFAVGLDKLLSGNRSSPPPIPSGRGLALPSLSKAEVCPEVRVVVEQIESVPQGFFLPDGGYELQLLVTNLNAVPIALPAASNVALLAGGREFSPVTMPDTDNWFLSTDVGAQSSRSLRLVVGAELGQGGRTLDGIRIPGVRSDATGSECTVTASFGGQ